MTFKMLAKQLKIKPSLLEKKAIGAFLLEQLRLVRAEKFAICARLDVKTVEEMDKKIASGQLKEEEIGEDFFKLDYLQDKEEELEVLIKKLEASRGAALWKSIQSLPEFPRVSLAI